MSAWDDIISKRLSPGTGPIGVKGIKPIHSKVKVCTKIIKEFISETPVKHPPR